MKKWLRRFQRATRHSSSDAIFTYTPLRDPSDLRLLKLDRPQNEDRITASLLLSPTTTGSDGRLKSDIPYTALSYTWGETTRRVPITVDGKRFLVTESLFAALEQLRWNTLDEPLVLWIDAVCINQEDNTEKAHQVARMGAIYEGSTRVLVWLGPEADGSDLAMQKLQEMNDFWESYKQNGASTAAIRELLETYDGGIVGAPDMETADPRPWLAIQSLFRRPWWQPVWVIQEATTITETHILCGAAQISLFALEISLTMIVWIVKNPRYSPLAGIVTFRQAALRQILDYRRAGRRTMGILDLLEFTLDFKATDPRDKIYALLSLFDDPGVADGLIPLYSAPTRETYVDFAGYMVDRGPFGHQLDILGHRGSFDLSGRALGLPSWVPNWVVRPPQWSLRSWKGTLGENGFARSATLYAAGTPALHGRPRMSVQQPQSHRGVLVVQGFVVDEILTVSRKGARSESAFSELDVVYDTSWQVDDKESGYLSSETQTREDARLDSLVANVVYNVENWPVGRGAKARAQKARGPMILACLGRRLVQTTGRRIGLAPIDAVPGDKTYLLYGGQVLYVLRQVDGRTVLVGQCYLHGLMDGEGLELVGTGADSPQWETIHIV
ncbi:heterokaryon incompatibility protein-domain-containing protein [Podospora aff. communis PSN243]|uniref:Heterokaryon incompatibility protein-domain-containing protein n=1 Tax=Podospora aff. communis PSN243 TaxID=3040156 RepID=A0AAV9FW76_9PEZI|nr:heterokaryon incompatibility protein-domain-containing protein [Podospora aff. communis PSN243]